MKVGIFLPQIGQAASKSNVIQVAKESENHGLDSLWVLERMLFPVNPRTPYGATPDGKLPADYQIVFDPLDLLSFVAGQTSHISLGTSVVDMFFHNPVALGRRFATLDVLSDGRAIAGLGLGWSKDEYEAANVPFEKKGARADEFVQAINKVWTDDVVEFAGQFYKIAASKIGPKPVQKPHPPMILGGFTPKTFERIVKYADGWLGVAAMPLPQLEKIISGLKAAAASAGKKTRIFLLAFPYIGDARVPEETRGPMTGTVQQVGSDIEKLKGMGVEHLILAVNAFTPFMKQATAYVDLSAQLAHYAK